MTQRKIQKATNGARERISENGHIIRPFNLKHNLSFKVYVVSKKVEKYYTRGLLSCLEVSARLKNYLK